MMTNYCRSLCARHGQLRREPRDGGTIRCGHGQCTGVSAYLEPGSADEQTPHYPSQISSQARATEAPVCQVSLHFQASKNVAKYFRALRKILRTIANCKTDSCDAKFAIMPAYVPPHLRNAGGNSSAGGGRSLDDLATDTSRSRDAPRGGGGGWGGSGGGSSQGKSTRKGKGGKRKNDKQTKDKGGKGKGCQQLNGSTDEVCALFAGPLSMLLHACCPRSYRSIDRCSSGRHPQRVKSRCGLVQHSTRYHHRLSSPISTDSTCSVALA